MRVGVGVSVGVAVTVGVSVDVGDGVAVRVGVEVGVEVGGGVSVTVGVVVGEAVGVTSERLTAVGVVSVGSGEGTLHPDTRANRVRVSSAAVSLTVFVWPSRSKQQSEPRILNTLSPSESLTQEKKT